MKRIYLILILALGITSAKAQIMAVKTNLATDVLMIPDLGIEMTISERSTLGLSVTGGHNPWGKTAKGIAIQPEWRYYFGGRPMSHHFVGIGLLAGSYNLDWKHKHYRGDAIGGGLIFGYTMYLTKRLNLDAHAGLGLARYRQQKYDAEYESESTRFDGNDDYVRMYGTSIIPMNIGLSLSYIFR